ncbi:MAG TPA: hypothetical protein PKI19_01065 [Elusimicrobiales bacterium]|nr:hypothetical protein [Elusimicrobiales bacterium]
MSDKRRRGNPGAVIKTKTSKAPAAAAGTQPDRAAGGRAPEVRLLWSAAFALLLGGYALLLRVDPGGQNGWAIVSPALLLAGYLLFIPAILLTYRR